ncbi:MAG: LysR family transcriptional regulator [Bacteroidales bacterium]|nr:LysR family transcriptional regulator [Bacteroidales bacterium]
MNEELKCEVGGVIWIELSDGTRIGHGKIQLLEKAGELGSLRQAAIEIGISYRQAWYKINQMNTASNQPLLSLKRGGKEGGKAELTELGKALIQLFQKKQILFNEFLSDQSPKEQI